MQLVITMRVKSRYSLVNYPQHIFILSSVKIRGFCVVPTCGRQECSIPYVGIQANRLP